MTARLVVSPDAVVRFKRGKIWIHTAADPSNCVVVDRPDLVSLMSAFVTPRETDGVVAMYPPPARQSVSDMIGRLRTYGVLIEASAGQQPDTNADKDIETVHSRLAELARTVYDIASDLRGLGPNAQSLLGEKTGADALARVIPLLSAADGFADELRVLVDDHLDGQLADLGIAPGDRNLKLHIGAGGHELPGWVNIDIHPAPLSMNLKWGLPFEPGSVDYVFMSHLFEHLFYPRESLEVLKDIHRVLAPGGVLRIIVPDIEKCIEAYVANDRQFFDSRKETWDWWPEAHTRLEDFLIYAGAGPDPGLLFDTHKLGYDFETLDHLLKRAGFGNVEKSDYMASRHDVLRVDDASLVAAAKYGDDYYSLFVDATR